MPHIALSSGSACTSGTIERSHVLSSMKLDDDRIDGSFRISSGRNTNIDEIKNLVQSLSKKVESLKIGPGLDKKSQMGPLVTKEHLEKVKGYVDIGVKEGAKLVVDGRNLKLQGYENGFYMGGCLFDNVKKDMRIYKEEIFGPVLSVVRAKDYW